MITPARVDGSRWRLRSYARFLRMIRAPWVTRASTLAAFRAEDWRLLAEAATTLIVVSIGLRLVVPGRLLAWAIRVRGADAALTPETIDRVRRTTWLVGVAARRLRMKCLARSLALARMLARRGVATRVRIGVRSERGQLAAHAWVECHGRPLAEDARALTQFNAFDDVLGERLHA